MVALQKFEALAAVNGTRLETLTSAAQNLARGLGGSDKGVLRALDRLGLSQKALMEMKLEDSFVATAQALAK